MTDAALLAAMEATWPAAGRHSVGAWTIREGRGGGQRVSAASVAGGWRGGDVGMAEDAMRALGQGPIFLLTPGDVVLDAALEARGYVRHDPVVLMAMGCGGAGAEDGLVVGWPPDAAARALWQAGGIGPARIAVMDRVAGEKAMLLARDGSAPAGVVFVAMAGEVAVLHALEVAPAVRRRGIGARILRGAVGWACLHGATRLALAVTEANTAARGLYAGFGMRVVGGYHYRVPGVPCA